MSVHIIKVDGKINSIHIHDKDALLLKESLKTLLDLYVRINHCARDKKEFSPAYMIMDEESND